MRRMTGLLLLATVPLALAADPAEPEKKAEPPEGFKEFASKDKTFAVWLPRGGRRSERERTLTTGLGRLKVSEVTFAATEGTTYRASSLLVTGTSKLTPLQRIEVVRDVVVEDLTGKVLSDTDLKPKAGTGKEYVIQTGRGQVRLRVLSVGSRLYQAAVIGTKEQTESKTADTFLGSLEPTKPPPSPLAGGKMVAVKSIAGDVHEFVEAAVKDKRLLDVNVTGFKLSDSQYRDVAADGGVLIGLEVAEGTAARSKVVAGLRPIYRTKKGEQLGEWQGKETAKKVTLKAKDGYVVGGMRAHTQLNLNGLSLLYMKQDGGKLDVKDTYKSEWVGGTDFGKEAPVGGQGYFFVGVCGHLTRDGRPSSVGLIAVLEPKK